jgi:hypothetical protein
MPRKKQTAVKSVSYGIEVRDRTLTANDHEGRKRTRATLPFGLVVGLEY